eukprot:816236_1
MGNTFSKVAQIVLGIGLFVGGVAITVMSGGSAAPLGVQMITGAMVAGGVSGVVNGITGDGNWGKWLKSIGLSALAGMFFVPIIGDAFGHMVTEMIQGRNVIQGLWQAIAVAGLATLTMGAAKLTVNNAGNMYSSVKTTTKELKGNLAKAVGNLTKKVSNNLKHFPKFSKNVVNDFVDFCKTIPSKNAFTARYTKTINTSFKHELSKKMIECIVKKAYENYMLWLTTHIGQNTMYFEGIPGTMYQKGDKGRMYKVGNYGDVYQNDDDQKSKSG